MNELLEQFLIEARELTEQATDDLLALEENPADRGRLDSLFRAFHTLKGSAGIVDFAAMAHALHAAEDVLARVRSAGDAVEPRIVAQCLACLDRVRAWLDHMETHGEAPAEADAEARAIVQRLARSTGQAAGAAPAVQPEANAAHWPEQALSRHRAMADRAASALRYTPDADSFFRGEDPLAVMAELPGLLALDLAPRDPWPPIDQIDPYLCNLRITALLSGPPDELAELMQAHCGQIELRAVSTRIDAPPDLARARAPDARTLIAEQILLLAEPDPDGAAGRAASAARVAANVLRHGGRVAEAERIGRIVEQGSAAGDPARLPALVASCLREILDGGGHAGGDAAGDAGDDGRQAAPAARAEDGTIRTLRVDAERVDTLVALAGELTAAKNALAHAAGLAAGGADPRALAGVLRDQHGQLDRLVAELQRSVVDLRVLPMRQVFQRFPRLVREISVSLGKPVRLVLEGEETQADKTVVENLPEPLLHLVRNAIDHGVESGPERAARGKPATATIRLRAARAGERVAIEVADDGRGIDPTAIRRAAAERGLAAAEALDAMPDAEAVELIFAPGFSTAAATSALSGRGVGMDAVRTAVERLGGRVDVESSAGKGTTVRLTLPFTVMMTRVMTVEAGGQVFGIPLDAVVESVRLRRSDISPVGGAHAFVLRSRTIPLVRLAQVVGAQPDGELGAEASVVVARTGGALTGLEVERLGERMDVMLKPVEGLLAGMRGIAGTALLGDGRVLIVIDVQELMQ